MIPHHDTLRRERLLDRSLERVFAAYVDPHQRAMGHRAGYENALANLAGMMVSA